MLVKIKGFSNKNCAASELILFVSCLTSDFNQRVLQSEEVWTSSLLLWYTKPWKPPYAAAGTAR